jgi:hypothetical protein
MKLWKVLGVAGLAGVAATGVIIAREQRQRAQLSPDEVRLRLHQRLEQAGADVPAPTQPSSSTRGTLRGFLPLQRWWRPEGRHRSPA